MPCYRPLDAWQLEDGSVVFSEKGAVRRPLRLPCGRCVGCRDMRVRGWAIRCMHEASMHEASSFVTLTYDGAIGPSINYLDFQKFMKRLRRRVGPARFFMSGEYGEMGLRPHFHALLFGVGFSDLSPCGKGLFRSAMLESLWRFGFSSVGDVTLESAAYVAGYAYKKISGEMAHSHYSRVDVRTGEIVECVPEFGRMSLKPGIGYSWFQKYWRDVFGARDGVVLPGGRVVPAPRYYSRLLESLDGERFEELEVVRYRQSAKYSGDDSDERLAGS